VGSESLCSELFVLGARTAVVSIGQDADPPSRSEVTQDLDIARVHEGDEVLHDDIHTVFVEGTMVAEAEEIELETLALDHAHIRDIVDVDRRIVGLSGDGAEAGELGAVEAHPVVIALMLVGEGLQHLRGVVLAVLGGLRSKEREFALSVTYASHRDIYLV